MTDKPLSRKEQILQALAHKLEAEPGGRITTAGLAREVGVSEAALYRHFPSKARIFEGLIEFAEESMFGLINQITASEESALIQTERIILLLISFMARYPGITRLLTGDALAGENHRLRSRINQFFDRIEGELRKVLRHAELKEGLRTQTTVSATANLLLAYAEGKIAQFVRSNFSSAPSEHWQAQWEQLAPTIFR